MGVNVIDVGCADHGEPSIPILVERFGPTLLFGLDPHPNFIPGPALIDDTIIVTTRAAAWTYNGTVGFEERGDGSRLMLGETRHVVPCYDIADLVRIFSPVILKIDAEGSEYALLRRLRDEGLLHHLVFAWIEWHGDHDVERDDLIDTLPCEYEEWLP